MWPVWRLVCLLLIAAHAASAAELVMRSQYTWSVDDPGFGGFSGLWVAENGEQLLALSDRGYVAKGRITRTDGEISDITATQIKELPLVNDREPVDFLIDAEGLAVAPDGSIYISYEGHHRVWKFDENVENPEWTHKWNFFWRFQNNSGLEALAADKDGTIYAIPERSGKWERPFPVQRLKDGQWDETLSIPRSKRFLVVGADFGPDGRLYVLERDFDVLSAFKSRIRRFNLTQDGFDAGETILETRFSAMQNAEGISLWRDPAGDLIVTTISDDNYTGILSTLVTEFVLRNTPGDQMKSN